MQPASTHPHKRGLIERAALIGLVGLAVLSVVGVGVVTTYLNRLSTSAGSITRFGDMPDYLGRPEAVTAASGGTPMNLLILVDQGGSLDSVVIANLSASRRSLTLITVPGDLVVSDSGAQTLASSYAIDPSITVLAMEGLTGARMDHQLRLSLGCLSSVIDRTGGIQLSGVMMSGADAVRHTQAADTSSTAAVGTARLIRSALIGLDRHFASLNPSRFADMVDMAAPCLAVDNGVTNQVVQSTFFESSIHPDETRIWPLGTKPAAGGVQATAASVDELRDALAVPELSTTAQYQQAAFVPQEWGR